MASDPFDPALDPLSRRIVTGLSKVSLALRHRAWQEAGERGLTPTQGQVLALLKLRRHTGARLHQVSQALGVTPPTASDAVASLARKGLVRKRRSPEDSRTLAVTLTERGRREAERALAWPDFMIESIVTLGEREQRSFFRLLLKLIRGLQARDQINVGRMCVTCRFFQPNLHRRGARPHHCAFVDAPLAERQLRLECPDQEPAPAGQVERAWQALFLSNNAAR